MNDAMFREWFYSKEHRRKYSSDHPAYLAAREAWLECGDDELLAAAKGLRDDLLSRAEVDPEDGTRVVNASHSRWVRFRRAIRAAEEG